MEKKNVIADALSIITSSGLTVQALYSVPTNLLGENTGFLFLGSITKSSSQLYNNFQGGKSVIVEDLDLKQELMNHYRNSTVVGHSGINAIYMRIFVIIYWKNFWKYVKELVRFFNIYQRYKHKLVSTP